MSNIARKPATYWLEVPLICGEPSAPVGGEILIVGAGLAGVSLAFWLQEQGFQEITLVDYSPDEAATCRNCGHILYGTVESMAAMVAIHGRAMAEEVLAYSVEVCHQVRETVARLHLDVEYRQDGYLVMAIDEAEMAEIEASVALLLECGVENRLLSGADLRTKGFREVLGGRWEAGSAQAHPVKFRNGLLKHVLERGCRYHSGVKMLSVEEDGSTVLAKFEGGEARFDAAAITANAYSPLFNDFFRSRRLIEPFRGQIIVSEPLAYNFPWRGPHSFDHGYEYALVTSDNRLMIGGWRNQVPGKEIGSYDLSPNPLVENGLREFVSRHYEIPTMIPWEYSWTGVMASTTTGLPFIGPTQSQRIFSCAGFNGHGFSWAHGSAKLLAAIMAGDPLPQVARYFNPRFGPQMLAGKKI